MDPDGEVSAWSQFYLGEALRPPQPSSTINRGLEEQPPVPEVVDVENIEPKKETGGGRKKKTPIKKPKKAVKRKATPPKRSQPAQKRRKIKESIHNLVYSGNFKPKKNTKRVVF
jgi:hypothetical protein